MRKNYFKSRLSDRFVSLCLAVMCLNLYGTAQAQSTFTNNTPTALGDNALCVGATGAGGAGTTVGNVDIPFNVTGLSSITDLNVGLLADHTWRGDLQVSLISPSPSPTTIVLITPDTSNNGNDDNYNIELDSGALNAVNTGPQNALNDTSEPPYQFLVSPNNSLDAYNGITNMNGLWTLRICDSYAGENGQFLRADLFFNKLSGSDLSLAATSDNFNPTTGTSITLTYTVSNNGPTAATGVAVDIPLPAGLSFTGQGGTGTYNSGTGVWTIPGSIGVGASVSKTITVNVQTTGPYSSDAEISASALADSDSTPGNGIATEDDFANITIIPLSPVDTPPALNCPIADQFSLVWDAPGTPTGWTADTLTNSYTAAGVPINFAITGDTALFAADNPVTSLATSGGITPADYGLFLSVDFANRTQSVDVAIDLGTPGEGVEGVQIPIIDVDNGSWVDRIIVTGSIGGTSVSPVLSSGASNSVSGNSVIGTAPGDNATDQGTMFLTFLSPVDKINLNYGNDPSVQANPGGQVIKIRPITMCPRLLAELSAVKSVEVYDPANAGLYMTPGNEVLYRITVNNSATATADATDIDLSDTLPSNVRFVSATTTGFTGGAFSSPDLPPANTDCVGGACVIRYTGASLPINTTGEIQVRALIK